jgi:anti-sigma regulatory factor (Ser/Thr protein kinase)
MCADVSAIRHNAFVYDSEATYVDRSLAFLREGLERGEAAMVAHTRDGLAVMREALGADAERVAFFDVGSIYTRPARAIAAYYGAFSEALRHAPAVRAVAEGQFGPTLAEWKRWMAYEALTNLAYAHLPAWVVCTYNANGLPDSALEAVWQTHPEVLSESWHESDQYEDPRELVRRLSPQPEPLIDLRPLRPTNDPHSFRERLARELVAAKVPETKALEMLVAASELAENAVVHGGGIDHVRTGRAEGRFVCEIVDRGNGFDDPAAGYVAPREGVGAGLWVARQLAWRLEFFRSSGGFTARLWL